MYIRKRGDPNTKSWTTPAVNFSKTIIGHLKPLSVFGMSRNFAKPTTTYPKLRSSKV